MSAQNPDSKWTLGAHIGSVIYSDLDGKNLGGAYIDQIPRFTLSRYMFSNITFEGAIGTTLLDNQKYTTFDGIAKYDFGKSFDNVVPYILIGGSFIKGTKLTTTLNLGAGNTFWIFPNYGLNIQVMYKYSDPRYTSQFSHLYPTIGIVYSFKSRNMNRRLWHMNH
ncbi:hypothetical protein BTO18_15245 [Polaribacter porphyrae]|uniref:Outer membrane protein beta-barrel domain-containing protein n=2 Tax=Polaribacter porphyrae TaxID=1137780 RepID=A0A2S7WS78_9FLAO|nr:hypothetical protein BTO18_15245 [Polaribacter porphyrae]